MMPTPPPTGVLISLEAALAALLDGLVPVVPRFVPLDQALGRIAAEMPAVAPAQPARDIAATDGFACRALELTGASAYSPVALADAPTWVEIGDVMPLGCDCVLHADMVDFVGPMAQAVGEAAPGKGVRRTGEDMAACRPPILEGRMIRATDLLVARKVGLGRLAVRSPRVRVIDVAAADHGTFSTRLVTECLTGSNATVAAMEITARDAASIADALVADVCDVLVLIGGTGEGRTDVTAEALALRGVLIAHRIAIRPGGSAAIGRFGNVPLIALAGSPDQAFAGFFALVQPVLDRLSGRHGRAATILPLSRKISSTVGLSEVALLGREQDMWTPLAIGDFSLEAMRLADAWLVVPGDSEGYAVGTPVAAMPLRNSN